MNLHFKISSKRPVRLFSVSTLSLVGLLIMILMSSLKAEATFRPYALRRRPITVVLTSGTSWTVPLGISKLYSVECWGAGGGSAGSPYGGSFGASGGGAYAKKLSLTVTPGANISYSIGVGGTSPPNDAGTDGGDTWFMNTSTVLAKGGKGSAQDSTNFLGGAGGAAGSSVGDVVYSGGKGGDAPSSSGSGGGSSATPTGAGANGADCLPSGGGAGGSAINGGAGGAGGAKSSTPTPGGDGVANPRGGGGGGGGGANIGAGLGALGGRGGFPGGGSGSHGGSQGGIGSNNGAGGQIIITYKPN